MSTLILCTYPQRAKFTVALWPTTALQRISHTAYPTVKVLFLLFKLFYPFGATIVLHYNIK